MAPHSVAALHRQPQRRGPLPLLGHAAASGELARQRVREAAVGERGHEAAADAAGDDDEAKAVCGRARALHAHVRARTRQHGQQAEAEQVGGAVHVGVDEHERVSVLVLQRVHRKQPAQHVSEHDQQPPAAERREHAEKPPFSLPQHHRAAGGRRNRSRQGPCT